MPRGGLVGERPLGKQALEAQSNSRIPNIRLGQVLSNEKTVSRCFDPTHF